LILTSERIFEGRLENLFEIYLWLLAQKACNRKVVALTVLPLRSKRFITLYPAVSIYLSTYMSIRAFPDCMSCRQDSNVSVMLEWLCIMRCRVTHLREELEIADVVYMCVSPSKVNFHSLHATSLKHVTFLTISTFVIIPCNATNA
jgi:hypothetical protein